jgi:4'-phosphopantetheinyl transferase
MSPFERLAAGWVGVWLAPVPEDMDLQALRSATPWLSAEEEDELATLHREETRRAFVVSHGLLRLVLSHHVAVERRSWTFVRQPGGRPEIASPSLQPPLRFSLSHTEGLVACGVALDRAIGVDVERLREERVRGVLEQSLSPSETASLRELPRSAWPARVFACWTVKESYLKACGAGLALPPRDVLVTFAEEGAPELSFGPRIEDEGSLWQAAVQQPLPGYVLAVTVQRLTGERLPLRIWVLEEYPGAAAS